MPASSCAPRTRCSRRWAWTRSRSAPLGSWGPAARPLATAASDRLTSSPHERRRSRGSPGTACPIPRSAPGCSSAPARSSTTSARSTASSTSRRATSLPVARAPRCRSSHVRSADGEDALHPGLGVAGHRAEVAETAPLVERDGQPRRLAWADQSRLLAADAEVVSRPPDVVEGEGDRSRLRDRRLGDAERELLSPDRGRGRGRVGRGASLCRGEPGGRERGDAGGHDDDLVHVLSCSSLQFAVVPWSAPGALQSSACRRLFALRRGVYGSTGWPVEPFRAPPYASRMTSIAQGPARRGSGGGADREPWVS